MNSTSRFIASLLTASATYGLVPLASAQGPLVGDILNDLNPIVTDLVENIPLTDLVDSSITDTLDLTDGVDLTDGLDLSVDENADDADVDVGTLSLL